MSGGAEESARPAGRGNKSIARRLAASQLGREVSLLVFIDCLLAVAVAVYFFMQTAATAAAIESRFAQAAEQPRAAVTAPVVSDGAATTGSVAPAATADTAVPTVDTGVAELPNVLFDGYTVTTSDARPEGYAAARPVSAILDIPEGTVILCAVAPDAAAKNVGAKLFAQWLSMSSRWAFPAGDGGYNCVNFNHDTLFFVLWRAFGVLLIIEAYIVIRDIFRFRRRTRRMLRPLTELTFAARDAMAAPDVSAPASAPASAASNQPRQDAPLKLSGTIDALNSITERHLDRRVTIEDDRVELRGLVSAINGMLDRLGAAYRAQLRFVSDASHELRTPISVVQGYANLLDRWGKHDEKTLQESIDAIKNEAQSMKELVEQLLFLARNDDRSIEFRMEEVDVSQLCEEVVRETRMIDEGHEFAAEIEPGLTVEGDCQLLKQALRIFTDNSIKYTPPGGRIAVRTARSARKPGYVEVSVSDSGIGISEEALPHVFDRFFRADGSRARSSGGTGLGLSIAKLIIDRHRGFVDVVSREDVGAKFTMSFPEMPRG